MLATFAVAWRTATKRLLADWLVMGAVFISVLLAAALLAAGPIYADAVTLSALKRTIGDAPATAAGISAEITLFPEDFDLADQLARQELSRAMATTGGDVHGHIAADAYGLVDSSDSDVTEIVTFQAFQGIEERAILAEGRWPQPGGGVIEVAVFSATVDAMGLTLGDTLEVVNRLDRSSTATVEVVGILVVADLNDPYWLDRQLIGSGSTLSGSFRSFGPLVVDRSTLLGDLAPARVTATWRALPDFEQLSVAGVPRLRESTSRTGERLDLNLPGVLGDRAGATSGFTVMTELPSLLTEVDNSLTVTRSSVLALLFQLAILAGYALVLTAGLLADTRSTETALVRSRGSSPRQMVTTALFEALLIAVPAALAAPFLATWLLGLLNRIGPLATIDLTIEPVVNTGAFVLATLAASLSVVVLTSTAYRSARAFPGRLSRRSRQTSEPISQRIGLDVALIALAILAFWQLQEIGPAISSRVRGQFGVDPLLVLAPALGLLAGAVLALRVVPLMARVADWLASQRKGTIAALASWQVSRRPSRYARSSLLLIMAIGIGFFAASYATSWTASQRDQAAFQTGADVRAIPWQGDEAIESMHIGSAYESLAGVTASMPVHTIPGQLGRAGELAEFVILDAAAAEVVDIRDDLSPNWTELMSQLTAQRPALGSIPLPGEPTRLGITLETVETIPEGDDFQTCDFLQGTEEPDPEETCFKAEASFVLQDGRGLLHRLSLGQVPVNTGVEQRSASLVRETETGELIAPVYPMRLVAIELRSRLPQVSSREVDMTITAISVEIDGTFEELPIDFNDPAWTVSSTTVGDRMVDPSIARSRMERDELSVGLETGVGGFAPGATYFGLRPTGSDQVDTIPVAVSTDLVEALGVSIGDTIRMTPLRLPLDSTIVGTFETLPTTDPSRGSVVADLPTHQMISYAPGETLLEPEEHWISTSGASAEVAAAIRTEPFNSLSVISQQELTDTLTADPVALATIGALTVGFVAAAVFSIVGFAVTATVSARERLVEFALIRALGMSRRQLGGWLGLEQGALVVVSLILGSLVGAILTAVLLPLVILTQSGAIPVPETVVIYPWSTLLVLQLAVIAALAIVVIVMTLLLRRIGLGSLLRIGED